MNLGGGAYRAYTSWEVAPGRRCISVARSSSVQGPYSDVEAGPLVCDSDPGGSIDPEVFTDTDGSRYLLWKSAGVPGSAPTKIKARKLAADGLSFAPGSSPVVLLQTELGWEDNSIENPSMVRYQGRYWLIYSGNEWESADYRTGQASCSGPLGPCTRSSSVPLIQNTATEWSPAGGSLFVDQAGRLHTRNGFAHHRAADALQPHEFGFGRQLVALAQGAVVDLTGQIDDDFLCQAPGPAPGDAGVNGRFQGDGHARSELLVHYQR